MRSDTRFRSVSVGEHLGAMNEMEPHHAQDEDKERRRETFQGSRLR
jgi:hypothetical protein